MSPRSAFFFLFTAVVLALMTPAFAAPLTFNYQARLTNAAGNPVPNGWYDIVITLWNDEFASNNENIIWRRSTSVLVADGLFTTDLDIMPDYLFPNRDYCWLGVQLPPDPECQPRHRVVSAPFAIDSYHAGYADSALNMPGLASNESTGNQQVSESAKVLLTLELTIPADGYIQLQSLCTILISVGAQPALSRVLIADNPDETFPNIHNVGILVQPSSQSQLCASRIFYKSSGTHTFYLMGYSSQLPGMIAYYSQLSLTASYFRSAYGLVAKLATGTESSDFSTRELQQGEGSAGTGEHSEPVYKIDLRELEIKALKARAEADKIEKELLKAKNAKLQEVIEKR